MVVRRDAVEEEEEEGEGGEEGGEDGITHCTQAQMVGGATAVAFILPFGSRKQMMKRRRRRRRKE